jgi:hypothetical protein
LIAVSDSTPRQALLRVQIYPIRTAIARWMYKIVCTCLSAVIIRSIYRWCTVYFAEYF